MSVAAGVTACALLFAACSNDDGGSSSSDGDVQTAEAGSTAQAGQGIQIRGASVQRDGTAVPVFQLPDGTLVANGTPITAAEATAVAAGTPANVGTAAAITAAAASTTPGGDATAVNTPVPQPTAEGTGRVEFASFAPVTAAVGEEFSLTILVDVADRPFQGYQWNIHSSENIQVLREEPNEASNYGTCVGLNNVAVNQNYGGCIDLGPARTDTYDGPLTVVFFRCASAGPAEIRLLNALEGTPFATALLNIQGEEFGGTNTTPVVVTCT